MVHQRKPKVIGNMAQRRRAKVPRSARQAHRAEEGDFGRGDAVALAGGAKDAPVEGGVVGGEERDPLQERLQLGPELTEGGRVGDVRPADAVDVGEREPALRGADVGAESPDDPAPFNAHDTDRTGAVATVVRRLKVDGSERKFRTFHNP